jgi:hypothetical protein
VPEELIEAVAKAICEAEKMNVNDPEGGWKTWRDAAIAAINAVDDYTAECGE